MDIYEIVRKIEPADMNAIKLAEERQIKLIKPLGSLGNVEDISVKIAGITGQIINQISKKILFLFGADNGVYEEGISGSPQELTATLMGNYAAGQKCAINVICQHFNVDLKLIDMGIKGNISGDVDVIKLMPNGTKNFLKMPAMPENIVKKALETGVKYAKYAHDNGYSIIGNGEVGMGNTTTATACVLALCGIKESAQFTGRGGGLTDTAFERKKYVINEALKTYNFEKNDTFVILSCIGGLDIAAMTGLYLGAAYYRIPIVIDGLISASAALLACRFAPFAKDYMIASHISEEPAYSRAIKEIGIEPMLALKMRLGEGSGCPFAFSIIEGAVAVMNNMATFDELKVDDAYRENIKME